MSSTAASRAEIGNSRERPVFFAPSSIALTSRVRFERLTLAVTRAVIAVESNVRARERLDTRE